MDMGAQTKTKTPRLEKLSRFVAAIKVWDEAGNTTIFRIWEDDRYYRDQVGIGDNDDPFTEVYAFGLDRRLLTKLGSLFVSAARLS
jgi:hypothetical protein